MVERVARDAQNFPAFTEDAINRLVAELEAGKGEALQNYLNTMG